MSGSPKVAKRKLYFISKWLFFLIMLPWTPRLQFWPACRNCFVKHPKCFRSKAENQKKCFFFSGKKLPKNVPLDTHIALLETLNAFLINLLETFTDSTNVFQSKSGNGERLHFLILQKSSWKRSPAHVETNFENRAEVYFSKDRSFFRSMYENDLKKFFSNFFSPQYVPVDT